MSKVQQHALKGQQPIAQGNALGNNKSKTKRPVRAKALKQNAFALTGRFGVMPLSTQGVALPFIHIFCSLKSLEFCI
ncbi:hypothetical protein, partial [Prevotella sp.]|uniref:hypothetical protein n=1 Tax=Prevotella sp. TaxID=59823 RepID=UPI0025CE7650